VAGARGPVVVLLHELGGTLDSWDGVAPGLSESFRVLRYDQRGQGLTEKVRAQFSNDDAVGDLEAMLAALALPPPYHLVAVAAASTQVLRFMERHPGDVRSIVLCNPAPGVDPSRAGVLNERADLAERDGMRGVMSITLDKSYPPELSDRATYESYRGRYLANDPVGFGSGTACWRAPTCCTCCRRSNAQPWWWLAATTPCGRQPVRRSWRRRFPAPASS